ncbi:MAG: alpha/beta hydrolase [Anaerolineae bacterium]|nr:MAG: alpha/beta hydrolase [Anaerolineae bacterium]
MRRRIFNLLRFALLCLLGAALLVGLGILPYVRAYGLVHPQRVPIDRTPSALGLPYEEVLLQTWDGLSLRGWYILPRNGVVVIGVHGMAGNRAQLLEEAEFLYANGYGILLFDVRNHGESEGEVTTLGLQEVRDVAAAVSFVHQKEGKTVRMAALGQSMGAATVLLAAAELPEIGAVIAVSPYTSLEDNLNEGVRALTGLDPRFFGPLVLFWGQWLAGLDISAVRPIDVIGQISPRAVLLIHGAQDTTLPVRNSYQLYQAAGDPKELVVYQTVGHGGFMTQEPNRYRHTILDFLERYLLSR